MKVQVLRFHSNGICMHSLYKGIHNLLLCGLYMGLFCFFYPGAAKAEEEPAFEEISVFFNVTGLGGKEVEAVIKNEEAYLSITDVFGYLKIKNEASSNLDSVSGFFLEPNTSYIIDRIRSQITLGQKNYPLGPDEMIQTPTALYLKSTVFGKVFGLNCVFNFRSLSVQLTTKLDLPVIREQRQELMRNNASKLKREIIADTIVNRTYSRFNAGAFDWSVSNTQQQGGFHNTRVNMRFGTIIAGGETNIFLNYDSQRDISLKEQYYQWRYINNDKKVLKQVIAGKISTLSTSSVSAPVIGVKLTNTPTTNRRSFDTYTLSDFTEPDWIVELYVNNSLLDYVTADASGFFTFRVPLVYGNSNVKLRFFGPWGEERTKEKTINVPYNFLPSGEMEYTLTAGMLEDGMQSRFSRADFKYGLSRGITIGSGGEYLSSIASGKVMPFINASVRLASNMLFSADYTYAVRTRALLNYRLPSNLLIELNYINYKKGQTAINGSLLEERKAIISRPFRWTGFSGFSRLTFSQVVYSQAKQTTADFLLSGAVKGISASLTTFASLAHPEYLNVFSNLAMTFQLPSRFTLRPQIQYGYKYRSINDVRVELEKQLFNRGFLNIEYANNINSNAQSFSLGLRFDLSFARTSFSARQNNKRLVFSQSFSGGLVYDKKTNYMDLNNRTNVGRGGLVIYPFLDINSNNRRDKNEPKIAGLQLKINGGRIENNTRDTTVQIFDLEPYTNYFLELNTSSFDNIAWQLKSSTYKVTIEANKLKLIEVPVKISGEVSGMVYSKSEDLKGQGRIIINFYRNGKLAGHTLSESDGYFNFLGLSPGAYIASVDSVQLGKLKITASPASMPFNIAATLEGDVVNDIDFKLLDPAILKPAIVKLDLVPAGKILNTAGKLNFSNLPEVAISKIKALKSGTAKNATESASNFSIIAKAIGNKAEAAFIQKNLADKYGHSVKVFFEGTSYYQLNIEGFENREVAQALLPDLARYGLKGLYVTAVRKKISQSETAENESEKINLLIKEDAIYFAVIVGNASDEAGIKLEQQRVLRILSLSSYPIKKKGEFRLMIIGFTDRKTAENAYQKLLRAGMHAGYITSYKKNFTQSAVPKQNPEK